MKVLVTGASGQLGHDVCKELSARSINCWGICSRELDITDHAAVQRTLTDYSPDAVIHCAAWTKVDAAEDNPETAFAVNATGTGYIANACKTIDAKLLYLSTDYVFPGNGERFYEPDDQPNPLNVYGASKLAGEKAIRESIETHFIVRTSWVFGINGNNFVKTMLRLAETHSVLNVVCDQIGSPTYTADLAPLLCDIIMTEKYGTYHATNEGICSWAEFAKEIFCLAEKDVTVLPIPTNQYHSRAVRPLNSRLSKEKLDLMGFHRLPDWKDALERYLSEIMEE